MLRPTLVYTETKKEKATLIILADDSRSMSIPDALDGKTRWDALRSALDDAAPALRELMAQLRGEGVRLRPEHAPAGNRRQRQDRPAGKAPRAANRHRGGDQRRPAAGGGQAAAGRDPAQRRRPAGPGPPRPAPARRRRGDETPGRSALHRRLRPVARPGRRPGRRRPGTAGPSHRLRQKRIDRHRPDPHRRLRQSPHPRAAVVRDLAGQDGGRGRGARQGGGRRPGHPRQIHLRPADARRVQADRWRRSPSAANW